MFYCGICGQLSARGESAETVVTETRVKHYKNKDKDGNISTSIGSEVVTEVLAHKPCADKFKEAQVGH